MNIQEFQISHTADVDFIIKQNDTFRFRFQVQNDVGFAVDFSNYSSARMKVRADEINQPVLILSSSGGTIDISESANGIFLIDAPFNADAGQYLYDFELSNSGTTQTIMTGRITIEHDYTD